MSNAHKKITLEEFFDSKEKLAIHCDTDEKAKKLCKAFAKMGKHQRDSGDSYYTNDNGCSYLIINFGWTIYEFEDVILPEDEDIATAMAKLKRFINNLSLTSVEKVFDILGVEPNEEFKIKHNDDTYVPHYKIDEELYVWFRVNSHWSRACIDMTDFIIGTYEIIKLPTKKKLRDLTAEEYEKWYCHNDCMGSDCTKCPFASVNCGSLGTLCWVNHKDLYSDKFLDQEIEIPIETEEENK